MRAAAAAAIELVILDVDGVLTDGRLYLGPEGEALKCFHVRDGHGIKRAQDSGIDFAVISGRKSQAVALRCRELGIQTVIQSCKDKLQAFDLLLEQLGIARAQCACIGDDEPDVPLMRAVGLSFAVADAHASARAAAHRVTKSAGGAGAVREVCDLLLAARHRRAARAEPVR